MQHRMITGTRSQKTLRRGESAQGLVEFALILPVLLVLILGVIESGRLLFYFGSVTSSAREAARYGAAAGASTSGTAFYRDCDGIRAAAVRIGAFAGVDATTADVDIQYDNGPTVDNIAAGCPIGGSGPFLKPGDRIIVTVTGNYTPVVGLLPFPPMDIESVSKRTVLVDVVIP